MSNRTPTVRKGKVGEIISSTFRSRLTYQVFLVYYLGHLKVFIIFVVFIWKTPVVTFHKGPNVLGAQPQVHAYFSLCIFLSPPYPSSHFCPQMQTCGKASFQFYFLGQDHRARTPTDTFLEWINSIQGLKLCPQYNFTKIGTELCLICILE